jgi:hypothetical protein
MQPHPTLVGFKPVLPKLLYVNLTGDFACGPAGPKFAASKAAGSASPVNKKFLRDVSIIFSPNNECLSLPKLLPGGLSPHCDIVLQS